MKSAAEKMKDKILKTDFKNPAKEVINVTAKPVSDSESIKKLLIDQITSKVRWEKVFYMIKNGINEFIEIGLEKYYRVWPKELVEILRLKYKYNWRYQKHKWLILKIKKFW